MAGMFRDKDGWRVSFTSPVDGKRKVIRLHASTRQGAADQFHQRLERIIEIKALGERLDGASINWLNGLSDAHHAKLAKHQLVESRERRRVVTIAELIERFEGTSSAKESTRAAYRQGTQSLLSYFGASAPIASITTADADQWRASIVAEGYAPATVAKRCLIARAVFRKAVRWRLIAESPFAELHTGSQSNAERTVYIDRPTIERVLDEAPDDQWKGIIALCRYAGLRCPTEIVRLNWADINWALGRMTVRSPKTAGHEGKGVRQVPIAPELRPILMRLFEAAEPGIDAVIPRLRDPGTNLRTGFHRIIERAGFTPWPRLFHNLRGSCASDWVERFPAHAVASWLGHSPTVAAKHYLTIRDAHFNAAAGLETGTESGASLARKPAQHTDAPGGKVVHIRSQVDAGDSVMQSSAVTRTHPHKHLMGATGFEPEQESSMFLDDPASTGTESGAHSAEVLLLAERLATLPPEARAALRALLGG